MSVAFTQCSKCGAGMGQFVFMGWRKEDEIKHLQQLLCDECKRIKAWLPEIIEAVAARLEQGKQS